MAGTIRVAPSGRTDNAMRRSKGSAWKPVTYAIETGCVRYAAPTCRFAIQRRRSLSGVLAATDLLNGGDANAVSAAGRLDLDFVADTMADQCLAQRRLVAHAAGFRVRLGRFDDAIRLLVCPALGETNGVAHRDQATPRSLLLDQHVVLDDRLELPDASFHHSLLVFGGVIFEVLRQVAQLAGGLDLGDDGGATLRGEHVKLLAHRLQPLGRDVDVVGHRSESKRPGRRLNLNRGQKFALVEGQTDPTKSMMLEASDPSPSS